jgi:PKHD-type hydroxylase
MKQVIKKITQEVGLSTNNLTKINTNAVVNNATCEHWFFESAVDKKTCDKIIALAKKWEKGGILNNLNSEPQEKHDIRETDVTWCNEQWVYDLVWDYLQVANRNSNWNFQIDCCEEMQIGRYNKDGHYDWHIDGNGFTRYENDNPFTCGKTRKLSMSVILNDEFEGGEFEFFNKVQVRSKRGTVLVFPSYMLHRVKPVTKGTRYSLVTWFCGEPFA